MGNASIGFDAEAHEASQRGSDNLEATRSSEDDSLSQANVKEAVTRRMIGGGEQLVIGSPWASPEVH